MAGIVWLASYPKSGNTWLRVFVENYRSPGPPADINGLTIGHAANHGHFDRFGAVEVSELSDEELEELRPALYRTMGATAEAPLFLKVHDAFGLTAGGVSLFPIDATQAVLYLVRHPCDVTVSLAHHFGISLGEAVAMLCREDVTIRDPAGQCRQRLRSWSGHVTSWIDESGLPLHAVRYEDLLADPMRGFADLLAAAGLEIDPGRLRAAVEHSRFERLQSQERAAGFKERLPWSTAPFFHTGGHGRWRHRLGPDLVRRIVDVHGEVMRRFGYLTPAGEPVG